MYKNHCSYSPISTKCPLASLHVLFPKLSMCVCAFGLVTVFITSLQTWLLTKRTFEMSKWTNEITHRTKHFLKLNTNKYSLSLGHTNTFKRIQYILRSDFKCTMYVCMYVSVSQSVDFCLPLNKYISFVQSLYLCVSLMGHHQHGPKQQK